MGLSGRSGTSLQRSHPLGKGLPSLEPDYTTDSLVFIPASLVSHNLLLTYWTHQLFVSSIDRDHIACNFLFREPP